jgi:hypothetical protein
MCRMVVVFINSIETCFILSKINWDIMALHLIYLFIGRGYYSLIKLFVICFPFQPCVGLDLSDVKPSAFSSIRILYLG